MAIDYIQKLIREFEVPDHSRTHDLNDHQLAEAIAEEIAGLDPRSSPRPPVRGSSGS